MSVTPSAEIIFRKLNALAVLIMVPKLPGFSIESATSIGPDKLKFSIASFFVINKTILDESGNHTYMDMVVQDYPGPDGRDGVFNIYDDRVHVGQIDSLNKWQGTSFIIDFFNTD